MHSDCRSEWRCSRNSALNEPVGTIFTKAQKAAIESATSQTLQLMLMIERQHQSGVDRLRAIYARFSDHIEQRRLPLRTACNNHGDWSLQYWLLLSRCRLTVTAQATIEAADLQVVAAPQSGYLQSAHVRAGDHVNKGQLLATLDQRDLQGGGRPVAW